MKTLLLLLFPLSLFAQRKTEKGFAKLDGGLMIPKGSDPIPAGFVTIGASIGGFALLGIGGGVFKPKEFSSLVLLLGGELTLVDTKRKISPALRIGGYKPITTTSNVDEKVYLTAGAGIGFFNAKQKGGLLTVNFSQFKYDWRVDGFLASIDQRIIYASFSVIL